MKNLVNEGIVWCRAASILYIKDLNKEEKLVRLQQALELCDIDNPDFYEDEVDIHLCQRPAEESGDTVQKYQTLAGSKFHHVQ
ncbi:hypothetical protein [Vibrio rhizosphaerae]|uniref:hypothetical protein n=1 Tax=Vibrio rhizosphaerae TaxID=398736 RepID=UPI0012F7D28D